MKIDQTGIRVGNRIEPWWHCWRNCCYRPLGLEGISAPPLFEGWRDWIYSIRLGLYFHESESLPDPGILFNFLFCGNFSNNFLLKTNTFFSETLKKLVKYLFRTNKFSYWSFLKKKILCLIYEILILSQILKLKINIMFSKFGL